MAKIIEGMRQGDLEDMMIPLMSVDEYASKIDDSAIVIGFYVTDQDAAEDLNRFIQRSPIELLDTEISPAPDQHGYFMVFIEFLNNNKLADNIANLLKEVKPLSGIDNWQMHIRGEDDLLSFSKDKIADYLTKVRKKDVDESILNFLSSSDLTNVLVDHNHVTLNGTAGIYEFKIVDLGRYEEIIEAYDLSNKPFQLGIYDAARSNKIQSMLGEGWSVSRIDQFDVLYHNSSNMVLILQS